jgi:hypothetical protein
MHPQYIAKWLYNQAGGYSSNLKILDTRHGSTSLTMTINVSLGACLLQARSGRVKEHPVRTALNNGLQERENNFIKKSSSLNTTGESIISRPQYARTDSDTGSTTTNH